MPEQTFQPEQIVYRGKVYEPRRAKVGVPTGTTGTIVSGAAGKQIVVLGYVLQVDASTDAKWIDGAGPTDLSGAMGGGAGGLTISAPVSRIPWFVLADGGDLQLSVTGGTGTNATGHVVYALVDA